MAITYTTNLNLAKPAQGDVDWHTPINENWDIIDEKVYNNFLNVCPTGSILMYGASEAPDGWLLCDGSLVSRTTYASLFEIIGTTFGAGDGSTTFKLPDLRDKFVVGAGTSYSNNDTGGEATHVLTIDEIPSHNHTIVTSFSTGSYVSGPWIDNGVESSTTTSNTGGGSAHNNLPPYVGLTFIIKA